MMKIAFVVICLTSIFAARSSPVKPAVDWPQARDKVNELKGHFTDVVIKIRNIIQAVEKTDTLSKLDAAIVLGQEQFNKLDKLVQDEKLQEEEAKLILEKMRENLTKIKTEILAELEKSDPEKAKTVEQAVEDAKKKCEPIREELYALLRA